MRLTKDILAGCALILAWLFGSVLASAADLPGLDVRVPGGVGLDLRLPSSPPSAPSPPVAPRPENPVSPSSVAHLVRQTLADSSRAGQMELETSLAQLGYKVGVQFDGAQSTHSATVFFPVPKDVAVTGGRLRIHYRASPLLHEFSNLRVYVNQTPRTAVSLRADGQQVLDIPLTKNDWLSKDGFVGVEFRASMLFSDDRCVDDRVNGGYLHIMPESSLSMTLSNQSASLRGAWDTLPHEVKVSLPAGQVSEKVFAAAWGLSEMLMRANKKVSFVRLPELGQIVIAPNAEMTAMFGESAGKANASVFVLSDGRRIIGLSDPFNVEPFYFLSSKWVALAAGNPYQVFPLAAGKGTGDARYRLPLAQLGLNTDTRQVDRLASWDFSYSIDQMPSGYSAESLDLDITAAPATDDHPAMFYVYFNNVLERAVRLPNDGLRHQISVPIPKEGWSRHASIRLVAQREYLQGDCHGDYPRFPMQVMPSSSLVVSRHSADKPTEFMGLSAYFRQGFDTYLPRSYLHYPERVLGMLTHLALDQSLQVSYPRLHFYDEKTPPKPGQPFLLLGHPAGIKLDQAPVRFDKGHIQVVDGKDGSTLLDVDQLPGVVVAQLVKSEGATGLWLAAGQPGHETLASNFQFDRDDVAFIDGSGVLLTLNSHEPGGAQLYYAEAWSLTGLLDQYRYWLLLLVWVAVTVGAVYLFRRTRQHTPGG